MLFLTIWSRINIGCKKAKDVLFNLVFGSIRGILFYMIISKYYAEAERGIVEKVQGLNTFLKGSIKKATSRTAGRRHRGDQWMAYSATAEMPPTRPLINYFSY